MVFNSLSYAIFLPIVFILYWTLPHKYRWILLLFFSYYFYMNWNPKYIVLILFVTVFSYIAARLIEVKGKINVKKIILIVALLVCIGILFFYKYFGFFTQNIVAFLEKFFMHISFITWNPILPMGISFYTFQALSYVIDVYKGDINAEHHFGKYATYIAYFPQLVAGPIEKAGDLLPQIKKEHYFDYDRSTYGLKLMVWGFFKKIVVADRLAKYVDVVYNAPFQYRGFSFILATLMFSIQIYCDFSGYSDIAIGTSDLLGIKLMKNFNSPYFSDSIKDFWRKWHISLSIWLRDYIYIPLGGGKKGKIRRAFNLIITFLVSGLWHGANWTFILWGGIHGIAQIVEDNIIKKVKHIGNRWVRIGIVFLFCSFAWLFFRADSISDALYIMSNALDGIKQPFLYMKEGFLELEIGIHDVMLLTILVGIVFIYDFFSTKTDVIEWVGRQKIFIRYGFYLGILTLILCFRSSGKAVFIYFQF